MFPVKIGKQYDVHHPSGGCFRIRVDKLYGSVIHATITQGKAKFIKEPDRGPGANIIIHRDTPNMVLTSVTE